MNRNQIKNLKELKDLSITIPKLRKESFNSLDLYLLTLALLFIFSFFRSILSLSVSFSLLVLSFLNFLSFLSLSSLFPFSLLSFPLFFLSVSLFFYLSLPFYLFPFFVSFSCFSVNTCLSQSLCLLHTKSQNLQ